jgi:hypothetical protein
MIFWVSFESDFGITVSTFEVKSKDFDSQVSFLVANLHSHVELRSNVQIISTSSTTQAHRQHISDHHELIFTPTSLDDDIVIKIFWIVLDYDFSLCHSLINITAS